MRVLVTGASGMLGATLVEKWNGKFDIFATSRKNFQNNTAKNFMEFDLLNDSYDMLIKWAEPDIIIHCGAITNVDYCEDNSKQVMEVNGRSIKKFLQSNGDFKLIFISSDAVFPDGIYMASEKDQTAPENIYGMSKELGEKYMQNNKYPHTAIRTTIIGKNLNPSKQGFVEWIIHSVKNGQQIKLFDDAFFTPISIWNLADELEWIIENNMSGIIHIVGTEPVSKYDLGMEICQGLDLDTSLIIPSSIHSIMFKAKRSKDQTLDSSLYQKISNRILPTTSETVDIIIKHFKEFAHA